jgi:hypothetical protein
VGLSVGDVRRVEVEQAGPGISCATAPAGDSMRINIFYSVAAQILPYGASHARRARSSCGSSPVRHSCSRTSSDTHSIYGTPSL